MENTNKPLSIKEASRQRMLWSTFGFIVLVTIGAFLSAWMDKDLQGISSIISTTIGALSILGVGNMATKPS